MAKSFRWAGYSVTKNGQDVTYDFHATDSPDTVLFMKMPTNGKSMTIVFTWFEMPPNTTRAAAKKLLYQNVKAQNNPAYEALLAVLGGPQKRAPRGSISQTGEVISPEEAEAKRRHAHMQMMNAIKE